MREHVGAGWDASSYHAVSAPHQEWGPRVMDRLSLRGDETVLDAGCGSGRVTRLLAQRLPRGRVVAVDGSAQMVEEARANLADLVAAKRAEVHHQDLLELALADPVDAVFSSAVLHWVLDHERVFERLRAALAPGGRMSLQCGGAGNIATATAAMAQVAREDPYRGHLGGRREDWLFAGAKETTARLVAAGFRDVRAWLEPSDQRLAPGAEAERYLATIVLRHDLARLPPELGVGFTRAVARLLTGRDGRVRLDYVRLNVDARA